MLSFPKGSSWKKLRNIFILLKDTHSSPNKLFVLLCPLCQILIKLLIVDPLMVEDLPYKPYRFVNISNYKNVYILRFLGIEPWHPAFRLNVVPLRGLLFIPWYIRDIYPVFIPRYCLFLIEVQVHFAQIILLNDIE